MTAPYAGDDPDGFVPRDEIVDYLEQYGADLPVFTGVAVEGLEPGPAGGFLLRTSGGQRTADAVVVCTGAYQRPHRPPFGGEFPRDLAVLDAEGYRNPAALPAGRVGRMPRSSPARWPGVPAEPAEIPRLSWLEAAVDDGFLLGG
ncbi:MAG TPA: hypothetical protein VI094_19450 [Propionibacteriaceae bacterium]